MHATLYYNTPDRDIFVCICIEGDAAHTLASKTKWFKLPNTELHQNQLHELSPFNAELVIEMTI